MIRFRYTPTFKDYLALNWHASWPRLRTPVILGGLAFAAYCIQPLAIAMLGRQQGATGNPHLDPLVFIVPILVLMFVFLMRAAMKKSWNRANELRAEREYVINDTGIKVEGASFSGFLEWQNFESAERKNGYFFLKTYQNQYHYFPETVIPECQTLIDLLATKIPKRKKG